MFTGFNLFSIALEVPISDIFPNGIPHNGVLKPNSTDSLLRVWSSITRRETQTVDADNIITGLKGSGDWVQVGRNALPLFNAGLVGTQRQTLYLRSSPLNDVTNFGADILFPVLVRDAEALGIYEALGVPANAVATLKGPRMDIINAINLGRPIPVADGFTGDVITLDAAIDSSFPNGRRLGGGTAPNRNQVNVNSVLISLIVAGDPAAGLAKGVEVNDKNYLDRFPFLAPAHQGLLQGHGGINVPTVPNIPPPSRSVQRSNRDQAAIGHRGSRSPTRANPIDRARTAMMSHPLGSSMFVAWRAGGGGHRPEPCAALRPRHVDRADDLLSGDLARSSACGCASGRTSSAIHCRAIPRSSISLSSRMRPAASRSSAATAPIRRASCAWPRPACSSSAIAATRAQSS